MASKKVCLLCLKRFNPSMGSTNKENQVGLLSPIKELEAFTAKKLQGHEDLYSRFLRFSSRYLKLPSSERILAELEPKKVEDSEVFYAFCATCFEIVSSICDLYTELNTIKIRLLWKLKSIPDLIRNSKKSVSFKLAKGLMKTLSVQLNIGFACKIDEWRKKVAFKCALKVNTGVGVPRLIIHRGLFPEHWKFSQSLTKQTLTGLIVVFLLASPEVSYPPKLKHNIKPAIKRQGPSNKRIVDEHNIFEDDSQIDTFSDHKGSDSDSDWSGGMEVASPADESDTDSARPAGITKRRSFRKVFKQVSNIDVGTDSEEEKETSRDKDTEFKVREEPTKKRLKKSVNKIPDGNIDKYVSCDKCSKKFKDHRGLSTHLIKQHRVKLTYPCVICGMIFGRNIDMQRHKRKKHNTGYAIGRGGRSKESKCVVCDEIFPSVKAMFNHCKLNHNNYKAEHAYRKRIRGPRIKVRVAVVVNLNLPCEICKETFESANKLRRHLQETHEDGEEKPFICGFCYNTFCQEQTHVLHLKTVHRKVLNNFQCDGSNCDGNFTTIAELNEHLKTHENGLVSVDNKANTQIPEEINEDSKKHFDKSNNTVKYCKKCNWGFLDGYNLELHVLSHTPKENGKFTCPVCAIRFSSAHILRLHYNKLHGKNIKRFECNECNKKFFTKNALDLHIGSLNMRRRKNPKSIVTCASNKSTLTDTARRPNTRDGDDFATPFSCLECDATFDTCMKLELHVKRKHGEKYPCTICGIMISCKEYVYQHMRSHQEPKHECNICHKSFKTTNNLTEHLKLHNPNRTAEFVCSECGMEYKSDTGLRYHVLAKHTPEELLRYSCPHCAKRYHRKMLLNMHVKTCAKLQKFQAESSRRKRKEGVASLQEPEEETEAAQMATNESGEYVKDEDVKMDDGKEDDKYTPSSLTTTNLNTLNLPGVPLADSNERSLLAITKLDANTVKRHSSPGTSTTGTTHNQSSELEWLSSAPVPSMPLPPLPYPLFLGSYQFGHPNQTYPPDDSHSPQEQPQNLHYSPSSTT